MSQFASLLESTWNGLPSLIRAAMVLGIGWFLAHGLRILVSRGLSLLHFERVSSRLGLTEFLRKGGTSYSSVQLVGVLVYWGILVATFLALAKILDMGISNAIMAHLRNALPSLFSALFIAFVGVLVVTFLANFARTLAANAGLPHAGLLAKVLRSIGVAIVLVMALDQAGLGKTILGPMILTLFGAIALAAALAFGLGCKDLARQAMERFLRNLRDRGTRGGDLEG